MPFKIIYLARRNPTIPEEGFSEAWKSHSRLASTLADTMGKLYTRVRQCIKIYGAKMPPEYVNTHDGSALLTMRSWGDLVALRNHPDAIRVMHPDEPRVFYDYVAKFTVAAEETYNMDKREGAAGLLHFVAKRKEVGPEDFQAVWNGAYKESILNLDIVKKTAAGFALNRVLDCPGPEYDFAGISELWFDDEASAEAAAWNEAHRTAMKSLEKVADLSRTVSLLTKINLQKKLD